MGILLFLNIWLFSAENTVIFKRQLLFQLSGKYRLITVGIASFLWLVVLCITLFHKGEELVWLMWIVTSLCISGYQIIYIVAQVIIDREI